MSSKNLYFAIDLEEKTKYDELGNIKLNEVESKLPKDKINDILYIKERSNFNVILKKIKVT